MSGRDEGWAPGDLALCVNAGEIECECGCIQTGCDAPPQGHCGQVISIGACGDDPTHSGVAVPCDAQVLFLTGGTSGIARRFIKVTPPEADEFDRETIALLTGKPVREPVQ